VRAASPPSFVTLPSVKVTTHGFHVLAVDPGIRGCGVALFKAGGLVKAAYVKNPFFAGNGAAEAASMGRAVQHWTETSCGYVDHIAVEWPQIYVSQLRAGKGKKKADPNDLLALCGVDAALAALLGTPTTSYQPHQWKGSMDKDASHLRIESRLRPAELAVAAEGREAAGALEHNVIDAIGIGLFHLGRFERRRVIAY
jgi:hypothetical protein